MSAKTIVCLGCASVLALTALPARAQVLCGDDRAFEPRDLEWNVGGSLALMLPSKHHNLRDEHDRAEPYGKSFGFAVRVGFLPLRYVGAELEGMLLHSSTAHDRSASLFAGRAHVIARLPIGRIVPFVLFGGGALGAGSSSMGTDTDPAIHFGAGVEYGLLEALAIRLDLRDSLIQRIDAAQGTLTHNPEVELGASVALEPRHEP